MINCGVLIVCLFFLETLCARVGAMLTDGIDYSETEGK